jgi:hypothetical protein
MGARPTRSSTRRRPPSAARSWSRNGDRGAHDRRRRGDGTGTGRREGVPHVLRHECEARSRPSRRRARCDGGDGRVDRTRRRRARCRASWRLTGARRYVDRARASAGAVQSGVVRDDAPTPAVLCRGARRRPGRADGRTVRAARCAETTIAIPYVHPFRGAVRRPRNVRRGCRIASPHTRRPVPRTPSRGPRHDFRATRANFFLRRRARVARTALVQAAGGIPCFTKHSRRSKLDLSNPTLPRHSGLQWMPCRLFV